MISFITMITFIIPETHDKRRDTMKFKTDPFYLYPIQESHIDTLFINREKECDMIISILKTEFNEICSIIGGIGTGKSSTAIYAYNRAKRLGKEVVLLDNVTEYEKTVKKGMGDIDVIIIDDIDKVGDEKASEFYKSLESIFKENITIFYTDTYQRDRKTSDLREFTASQYITLPRKLGKDSLNTLLKGRMINCVINDDFNYPFSDKAIEMASIRSLGNIPRFFTYAKHAWTIYRGKNKKILDEEDIKEGIINVDRATLGRLDMTDLRIIWNCTFGNPNKTLLAHQSDIHPKTLDNRIIEDLSGLITQVRDGQEVYVSSIYTKLPGGKGILEQILKDLERYDEVVSR